MRRFIAAFTLLLLLLALPAQADIPAGVWGRTLANEEMLSLMQAALAEADVSAAICTRSDGTPLAVYDFGSGFCAARRSDGLLMLCCFIARGDSLALEWHNDLLLSHAQPLSLSVSGPSWGEVPLPSLSLQDGCVLTLTMALADGSHLELLADNDAGSWRVTGMTVLVQQEDGSSSAALRLTEDALAPSIWLSACHPGDWAAVPD